MLRSSGPMKWIQAFFLLSGRMSLWADNSKLFLSCVGRFQATATPKSFASQPSPEQNQRKAWGQPCPPAASCPPQDAGTAAACGTGGHWAWWQGHKPSLTGCGLTVRGVTSLSCWKTPLHSPSGWQWKGCWVAWLCCRGLCFHLVHMKHLLRQTICLVLNPAAKVTDPKRDQAPRTARCRHYKQPCHILEQPIQFSTSLGT